MRVAARILFRLMLSLLLTIGAASMSLSAQVQTVAEMLHGTWAGHDGAPQGIHAVAMGSDGLLWIGTMSGLYSFDGNTFTPFQPRREDAALPTSVHFLMVSIEGDLWVFGFHGNPVRIRNGRTRQMGSTEGDTVQVMGSPQEAPNGVIWAVLNERALVRLGQDLVWHRVPEPGQGQHHVTTLHVDPRGTVWVVIDDRLYRLTLDGRAFEPTEVFVYGKSSITDGPIGDIWIASSGPATSNSPAHHLQHVSENGYEITAPHLTEALVSCVPAADGSLWILTTHSILIHMNEHFAKGASYFSLAHWADQIQLRTAVQAETNDAFLRSHDGALWIGGMGGIERFSDSKLIPLFPNALPGVWDNCVDREGVQWIIDPHHDLYVQAAFGPPRLLRHNMEALFCSIYGDVASDEKGLLALSKYTTRRLPVLPGLSGYSNHYIFTGATVAPDGRILAAAAGGAIGRSLWNLKEGTWRQVASVHELPEITAMHVNPGGEVQLGFRDGGIGVIDKAATYVRQIGRSEVSPILGFAESRFGEFAYGGNGIGIFRDGWVTKLSLARPELAKQVTGVVEAADGDVWFNAAQGIVRVPVSELEINHLNTSHPLAVNNIREGDLIGPSLPSLFCNRAQIDESGKIWFSTLNGIVSVSPGILEDEAPPALSIRSLIADGHASSENHVFPPGVGVVSIKYIGVDFSDPSSLSYAYLLEGHDKSWQYVGSRTEAVYTNLHAGRYRFQVKAQDAYGIWTLPTVLDPFTVAPHLYERNWFVAVCLLVFSVLVWAGARLRLHSVAANIRERAEARADERITIARDLHDTLLQGLQGLLLSLHAATERVPDNHESKQGLERALASAEKLILEGRSRVKGLRTFSLSGQELVTALEAVAEDLNCRSSFQINAVREESDLILHDHIASELFLVGREAILNAFQHTGASRISLRLSYGRANFTLECEDDGAGFDPRCLTTQETHGRWGVRGMQERTEKIGGIFEIASKQGHGTLVRARLPARKAYQ